MHCILMSELNNRIIIKKLNLVIYFKIFLSIIVCKNGLLKVELMHCMLIAHRNVSRYLGICQ